MSCLKILERTLPLQSLLCLEVCMGAAHRFVCRFTCPHTPPSPPHSPTHVSGELQLADLLVQVKYYLLALGHKASNSAPRHLEGFLQQHSAVGDSDLLVHWAYFHTFMMLAYRVWQISLLYCSSFCNWFGDVLPIFLDSTILLCTWLLF